MRRKLFLKDGLLTFEPSGEPIGEVWKMSQDRIGIILTRPMGSFIVDADVLDFIRGNV